MSIVMLQSLMVLRWLLDVNKHFGLRTLQFFPFHHVVKLLLSGNALVSHRGVSVKIVDIVRKHRFICFQLNHS